jgi:transcriptional regulator of arginine metabolism
MPAGTELRQRRQRAILKILQEQRVARQSHLVDLLRAEGIDATQSSVSRDLRQLGIAKLEAGYEPPETDGPADNPAPPEEFLRGVAPAGPNLLVVRTAVGAAARVAVYLDRSGWPEIVGTVSGDDTIFVATDSAAGQRRLQARLKALFSS